MGRTPGLIWSVLSLDMVGYINFLDVGIELRSFALPGFDALPGADWAVVALAPPPIVVPSINLRLFLI